jgi:uncharacterized protein
LGCCRRQETIEFAGLRSGIDMDLVTHDVLKFFTLLLKRNGYVLEQLYSPLIVQTSPEHDQLKAIAAGCVTRHHSHHYLGFAATQWGLFQKEEPPRVKPLLYVYRVLLTGIHLKRTGIVEANLAVLNDDFRLAYVAELIERKIQGAEKGTLESSETEFHRISSSIGVRSCPPFVKITDRSIKFCSSRIFPGQSCLRMAAIASSGTQSIDLP